MAGKIGGLMVGVVIDVNDPAGYSRIRVRIPALHGSFTDEFYGNSNINGRVASEVDRLPDNAIPWAQVAFPFGSDVPPELNQVVVVGFINGDESQPIVLGWLGYDFANSEYALKPVKGAL